MNENDRVPMRRPFPVQWVGKHEAQVSTTKADFPVGRRISLDIDEGTLAQIGARGLEHAVEQLGREIAYRYAHQIESAVVSALADPGWVKPILEDELRKAARAMVMALWSDEEKEALRGWFDLFAAAMDGKKTP